MIRIGAGYSAKTACSCVFVSKRDFEDVLNEDISQSAAGFITPSINLEKQYAEASFLGIKRRAIYRDDMGCTLISERTEEEIRSMPIRTHSIDLAAWPNWTVDTSLEYSFDSNLLSQAIDYAFDEPEPDNPRLTRAVIVIYKGKVLAERYGQGIDQNTRLTGWSMTKSVTNAMVGLLTGGRNTERSRCC